MRIPRRAAALIGLSLVAATSGSTQAPAPPNYHEGSDAAAYDPQTKFAFASCSDGTLTVVQQVNRNEYRVVQTVQTQRGSRTMALDPLTHTVYQAAVEYGPPPTATTPGGQPGRVPIIPGSFTLLIVKP